MYYLWVRFTFYILLLFMKKANIFWLLLLSLLSWFIWSYAYDLIPHSEERYIRNYFETESATLVSPHHVRKEMEAWHDKYLLVDLRTESEFEQWHIINAVNIPAYSEKNNMGIGDEERIVAAFSHLSDEKEIVIYCYSMPCMTWRKVWRLLARNNIYVKELGIWRNEWKYYSQQRNYEWELADLDIEQYIESEEVDSSVQMKPTHETCPANNELGC